VKIIAGRTIALIIHNGQFGLVEKKFQNKWTIKAFMDRWTLEEKDFVPILNLRKGTDWGLYTIDEIIGSYRLSIMNALRKKAIGLTKENQQLRIDVSTSRFQKKAKS
jgi:hypothetical protein